MTFLPKVLASSGTWRENPLVHERAGRLLGRLHASAAPRPVPDFAQRLLASVDSWAVRATQLLDEEALRSAMAITATAGDVGPLQAAPRTETTRRATGSSIRLAPSV